MARSVESVSVKASTATIQPRKGDGGNDLILALELPEPIRLDLRAGVPHLLGSLGGAPVVVHYGTARGSVGALDWVDRPSTGDAND